MEAVIEVAERARRVDRRRRDLPRRRGRHRCDHTDVLGPLRQGGRSRSGLSKAFAMPGLRVGWAVAPSKVIERIWRHHDYTTLTPGLLSDRLTAVAMQPARPRERPGPDPRDHPGQPPAARSVDRGPARAALPTSTAAGAIAFAAGRPAGRHAVSRRADPDGTQRAAGARRDVRHRERDPLRLRLRHRAHPEGLALAGETIERRGQRLTRILTSGHPSLVAGVARTTTCGDGDRMATDQKSRRRSARAEAKRELIVRCAMRHFAEHGYPGARIEDIAPELQIAEGLGLPALRLEGRPVLRGYKRAVAVAPRLARRARRGQGGRLLRGRALLARPDPAPRRGGLGAQPRRAGRQLRHRPRAQARASTGSW